MAEKILVVDDDEAFRGMLLEALAERGFAVDAAATAEDGIAMAKAGDYDLVLQDVKLPGMSGLEAMEHLLTADPDLEVIVMTAYSTKDTGVQAMKKGAYDYFTKPFSLVEMEVVVRRALEKRRLQGQVQVLQKALSKGAALDRLKGQSRAMHRVRELIQKVAAIDVNVLITGETGTGKELVADVIHMQSKRAAAPLVKLNCAAIPENLLESELFGHEKGAFTGAAWTKKGKFELAQGGSILLDEIGDLPLHLQPKLLRAVEQKQAERVGGTKPVRFDVRIIAATNQDLEDMVREKTFRGDLFYRLNVAAIALPALRERKEDLPLLARHFVDNINKRLGTSLSGATPAALKALYARDWPGNVRQLANTLERAAIFCQGRVIDEKDVEQALKRTGAPRETFLPAPGAPLRQAVKDYEKALIVSALRDSAGVQTRAARQLGLSPKNLWNKIKKHGIDPGA
ncbi:MAG: sigma-54-dependent Fis family transcriptional regulator [Desulfovibrionaceae bacterium]|nr:sigma-54-dependent Fis family transcriptional regulator [Desulfovibrionaceae bacterium]